MPYIAKPFIDSLLDDCQIETIIQDFVALKKAGANLQGLSPFVDEKTPSFTISPSKQVWKCFSSGKGGNNAISFLIEKGFTYPDAIKYIADKLGKTIQYDDSEEAKAYQEKVLKQEALRPILKASIKKYQEEFAKLPNTHPAKIEVARRGYNQEIIDAYQIGFAPGNKFLYNLLKEKALVDAGKKLSILNEAGDNDFYYNRVTYTIFDKNGEPIGLAGRDLNDPPKVKWINPKDTELYKKDITWYGLHLAKAHMRLTNTAYIVEGYNDVIAFQSYNLLNTVAGCGTNITDNQIKVLKQYADIVVLCMDGDAAGQKAAQKTIPRFLELGFRCYVLEFKDGLDPDEFVRHHAQAIETSGLQTVIDTETTKHDGFKILLDELKDLDDVEKSVKGKELCELISKISDESISIIYTQWLSKESKLPITTIKAWIKECISERETKEKTAEDADYRLPVGVTMTESILECIKRYQIFQAKNQVWVQANYDESPYHFRAASNFSVTIIQHMLDEEYPKKLVAVKNIHGHGFVFDVPSDTFNKDEKFTTAMTNFGNFRWYGNRPDLQKLQAFLFDQMGNGRSIDVLGWQKEGFYLFNNLVVVPGQPDITIDANGCFQYKGTSYYVPSANSVYKDNMYKYAPQKRFKHAPGTILPNELFGQIIRVHGNTAISGIMFMVASLFQDLVATKLKGFPILFMYGPPGTGKDELNYCLQSFWGEPQEATNLEGGNSTATANLRDLAQFQNAMMQWSEYPRGDAKLDGTIKSLWDLRGKKGGSLQSRISVITTPILSGVSLTGNEFPDVQSVITRLVWNDMDKIVFTDEDDKAFNKLADTLEKGITHITVQILHHRKLVEDTFTKQYRLFMDVYQARMPDANKRMLKNISVLTAFHAILKDHINFSFSEIELLDHFTKITEAQMRKLTSSSIVTRWWDCFIASMRGTDKDMIKVGRDLKLEGTELYFQFTNCFNQIQRQWFSQYRDAAPGKSTMREALRKDSSFVRSETVTPYDTGRNAFRSSAEVINIMKLPGGLDDLIKSEVERQEYELNLRSPFDPSTPLTPKKSMDKSKGGDPSENTLFDKDEDDLPY